MLDQGVNYIGHAHKHVDAFEERLTTVFDPDIGIDVVNLGLIYEINLDDDGICDIKMTFTSTGCNCQEIIFDNIREKFADLDFINGLNLNIVWNPSWNMSRITRFGRIALGINPN